MDPTPELSVHLFVLPDVARALQRHARLLRYRSATGRRQSACGLSGTNPGDLTAPEGIDWLDVTFRAWNWLIATTLPCYSADLTFDGKVDFYDFVHLGRYWQYEGPEMIGDEPLEAAP